MPNPKPGSRKVPADYIEAHLVCETAKWVSSHIVKGRRVCLYGISVAINTDKSGRVEMSPVIPCLGPLVRLLKKHPKAEQFQWNKKKTIWQLA